MSCDPSIYTIDQSDFMENSIGPKVEMQKKKNTVTVSNSLTGDQVEHFLWPKGGQNC